LQVGQRDSRASLNSRINVVYDSVSMPLDRRLLDRRLLDRLVDRLLDRRLLDRRLLDRRLLDLLVDRLDERLRERVLIYCRCKIIQFYLLQIYY